MHGDRKKFGRIYLAILAPLLLGFIVVVAAGDSARHAQRQRLAQVVHLRRDLLLRGLELLFAERRGEEARARGHVGQHTLVLFDKLHLDQHRRLGAVHRGHNAADFAQQAQLGEGIELYLHRLADFIATLKTVERVEVLPYHTLGTFKWENLHIDYPLKGIDPPTKERIENAEKILGAGTQ